MRLNALWPLALAAMALATTAHAQSPPSGLQDQAEAALVANQPEETIRLATQMLDAQPDSFVAMYLLALALADLGDLQAAANTGARAYAVATTEDTRFQAARLVAGLRFRAGQYTRSEFWLRRAANHAQTEAELRTIAEAYVASTDANPLSVQITASIAPTDNVNNGSDDGILTLESIGLTFILPEDRRSLSGVAFSASTDLRYRIAQSPQQSTSLIGSVSGETYVLSSEAKDLLASSPNPQVRAVDGGDFASVTASVGIDRYQFNISPLGPVRFGANLGTYWEGGERLVNFRDFSIEQIISIDRDSSFRLRGLRRNQDALTTALVDSTLFDVVGTYDRTLPKGDQLQLSLRARRNEAGAESSFDEYEFGVGYAVAQPIFGVQLSTSLQLGYRRYEEFATTLDGREDRFVSASATATFQRISYFGFSPNVALTSARTDSTAEENTSSSLQLLFGVTSNF